MRDSRRLDDGLPARAAQLDAPASFRPSYHAAMAPIKSLKLPNDLTLVTEPVESAASVALSLRLPIGSATDAPDSDGYSAMLAEMIFRGAGGLSSREHSDALDRLGVERSSNVGTHHLHIGATLMGRHLDDALPLIAGMITKPLFADDAIDPVRSLVMQSLAALDDDPQHLVMLRLRDRHLAPPFNRHGYGREEVLEAVTADELRATWAKRAVPAGSILSVAGAFDSDALRGRLDELFSGWLGESSEPEATDDPARGYLPIEQDGAQVHLAVGWDAPPASSDDAVLERIANAILSGSTSGRLFTELRQKRSLCYSVGASYRPGRDEGFVALYAGTTPERAQETLDLSISETERMADGAEQAEFDRAIIGLKSRIVMQGESTPARSARLGTDQFNLGRPRTLGEVLAAIDSVTLDALNDYLARRAIGPFTVVSIGPVALDLPAGAAAGV